MKFFLVMDFINVISLFKATILRHMYDQIRVKLSAYTYVPIQSILIASEKMNKHELCLLCLPTHIFFNLLQILLSLKRGRFGLYKKVKFLYKKVKVLYKKLKV